MNEHVVQMENERDVGGYGMLVVDFVVMMIIMVLPGAIEYSTPGGSSSFYYFEDTA